MREADLPSPGLVRSSMQLRRLAANAISGVQIVAPRYPGGVNPSALQLAEFFNAASEAVDKTLLPEGALSLNTGVLSLNGATLALRMN